MRNFVLTTFVIMSMLLLLSACAKIPQNNGSADSGLCKLDGSGDCINNTAAATGTASTDGGAKVGDTVEVNYVGKFNTGAVFDTNIKDAAEKYGLNKSSYQPLKFKIGEHNMIAGFETGVVGMKAGEEKIIKIPSEEAYGKKRPELIYPMSLANFTVNFPQVQNISAGVKVTFPYNGQLRSFFIYNTTENSTGKYVLLDFNNPMAGEDLEFYIKLVSITP